MQYSDLLDSDREACRASSAGWDAPSAGSCGFGAAAAATNWLAPAKTTSGVDYAAELGHVASRCLAAQVLEAGDLDEQLVESLAELLRSGAEAGVWVAEDPPMTAAFLVCGARRVVRRSAAAGGALAPFQVSAIVDLWRRIVACHAVAA